MKDDAYFMARALTLAQKGAGRVSPNPMVGAVLVKDGRIISEGYHKKYGGPHAERECLLNCTQDMDGAVLYVTLEPCCHYGKTPPCTQVIIDKGIRKVVVGAMDPNPLVAGKGIKALRDHGIRVVTGVLEDECREQKPYFFSLHNNRQAVCCFKVCHDHGRPYCHAYGKVPLDHRGSSPPPGSCRPEPFFCHYGRTGNSSRR